MLQIRHHLTCFEPDHGKGMNEEVENLDTEGLEQASVSLQRRLQAAAKDGVEDFRQERASRGAHEQERTRASDHLASDDITGG